jgi:membrane fusion protein, multidrug efflux system
MNFFRVDFSPGERTRFLLPVLLAFSALCGCSANGSSANKSQQKPPPMNVEVAPVVEQNVPIYGDWVATLDGYVNANIQPQVSGYLVKQNYLEGSYVHKGEVLFQIDPRTFQALVDQAKGQLAQAKGQVGQADAALRLATINVARDRPLASARAIAQSQLDTDVQNESQAQATLKSAQATVQAQEANVETAELNLGFTQVRSLVDGIAGIATAQIGNLVGPTTVLTSVSQVNPIKVYFPIAEQEYLLLAGRLNAKNVDLLRRNSSVPLQLTLSNGQVYPHEGRVIFADRQVDPQTGTIRMVASFPNPGNVLRPGQFGRVRALTAMHRDALLVPQRAVSQLQGRYQVATVDQNNKAEIHTVEVGDRVGGMWVINSGLSAGERVVTEGVDKVRDGAVVNPTLEKSAPTVPTTAQSSGGN